MGKQRDENMSETGKEVRGNSGREERVREYEELYGNGDRPDAQMKASRSPCSRASGLFYCLAADIASTKDRGGVMQAGSVMRGLCLLNDWILCRSD